MIWKFFSQTKTEEKVRYDTKGDGAKNQCEFSPKNLTNKIFAIRQIFMEFFENRSNSHKARIPGMGKI